MEIFGILELDPHENLCGSETLQKMTNTILIYLLFRSCRIWNKYRYRYFRIRERKMIRSGFTTLFTLLLGFPYQSGRGSVCGVTGSRSLLLLLVCGEAHPLRRRLQRVVPVLIPPAQTGITFIKIKIIKSLSVFRIRIRINKGHSDPHEKMWIRAVPDGLIKNLSFSSLFLIPFKNL